MSSENPERALRRVERVPLLIRPAEPEEADILAAIAWAAKASWGYSATQLEAWRSELSPSPASIHLRPTFVAEAAGEIVGFHALDVDGEAAELAHLWVQPAFMRRGVGSSLLAHAAQYLAAGGHACLHIDADPGAEPFYLAQGAARIGVTRAPIDGQPDRARPRLLLPTSRARVPRVAPPEYHVACMKCRQAMRDDVRLVAAILSAAASRLRERGQTLWSIEEVSENGVADHVEQGRYYIGSDETGVVGVFRFDSADPLYWPEMTEAASAYLHKVAVLPQRQGQGASQSLLACACDVARRQGLRYLRLDCAGGRPRLRAVYEDFGFRHHSDKILSGHVFHRFELDLTSRSPKLRP